MRFLKRVQESERSVESQLGAEWSLFKSRHPALAEYLEVDAWEDGRPRQTSTLLLFLEDGVVKACLNDRDADRALWVSGGSVAGVLESLEAALSGGTGEWRTRAVNGRRATSKRNKN
jgi:hypothetical protein